MDVELPNGEIITGVPDGMSKADLVARLRRNGHDLSWLEPPAPAQPQQAQSGLDSAEPAPAPGLSAVAGIANTIGEVGKDFGGFVKRSAARVVGGAAEMPGAVARTAENATEQMLGVNLDAEQVPRLVSGSMEAATAPVRDWAKVKEQEAVDALSPKARRALELSIVERDEEGSLQMGEGATDPYWWTANVIDVGMQAVPGLAVGGASARMAYTARYRQVLGEMAGMKVPQSVVIAKAEQEAMSAAKRAAMISGGLTEGIAAGGQNAAEVRKVVESLNEETLMAYPGYLELRDSGMSHEQARDVVAKDKAAAVAIATGAATGMTGAPMNSFFGELTAKFGRAAEPVTRAARAKTAAKGMAGEAAQEFVQEGSDQLIQNKALQPITGIETWDNVLESAITGGVLGGVVGGGSGVLLGGKDKKPGETPAEPSPKTDALSRAEMEYEQANEALQRGLETARDPKVPMKYADLQKLRDARKQAMVNFTRELMHSGQIKPKDQAKVADALRQAEAAGMPANTTAAAGGEVSPQRDAALEAVANAEQLEEADANDLIANGFAKVNPRGVVVLTPEGRRQRKAAQERAKEAEKTEQVAAAPAKKTTEPEQVEPADKLAAKQRVATRKPLKLTPVEAAKRQVTKIAEAAVAAGEQERRDADRLKATVQKTAQDQGQLASELEAQGAETTNPQMRDAFERARRGLPVTRDARGRKVRVAFRLKGAPETVDIPGKGKVKVEPVKAAKDAAAAYRKRKGITTPEQTEFARVDPVRAKRIAKAFDEMEHAPNDPTVKRAYDAMINETVEQFDEIKKSGLKIEFIKPGQKDPYEASPRLAIEDVRDNNHLWVFPTDQGFGSDDKFAKDNPMLRDTGIEVDGRKLVANDVFRIVHDYFGHVAESNGFRADGEENAWQIHARMYSPLARRAMTTETRGQNSWVNYGPKGESNRTAKSGETVYADQKIGLLPAEFSAFPGEKLKFKHFSQASDDQLDLDPEKMGTGAKGAEAKRGGPKVISLYAEHGETEPDVATGRTRYNVEIPAEDLYNASADPQGLLAQAQVPFGLTQDAQGNMVPVGHRFDMNKFEELVRDAGYLGYHLPEAQGILKGQARIFHKYPATREGAETRQVNVAARMKRKTSEEKVRTFLTPEENARLKKASAKKLIEVFDELPDGAELAAAAVAGEAKRGWYRRSAEALVNVFGPDAPRFTALLAALSPQTSVEWNFRNAVAVWVGWDKAGRPTKRKDIVNLMRDHLFPGSNKVGRSNVLGAWINNTVHALTTDDPSAVVLSGPKVDSFAANLRGETERVTLDAWMANWAGVSQNLFKGEKNVAGDNPGMRPGYLAFAARVREAAKILTERTGETWTPSEVQETVWSWAKTLYEQAESFGALATARELVDNNELTDELINATPDFAGLFADPEISSQLAGTVYGPRAARSAGQAASRGGAGRKATPAAEQDQRYLRRAADRLDALRKSRKEAEDETRESNAAAMKQQTQTPEFKAWFEGSKVTNPDGSPRVLYHGTQGDISAFARERQGRGSTLFGNYTVPRVGVFMAEDPAVAEEFATQGNKASGASVMPLYAAIFNPLDFTTRGVYSDALFNSFEAEAEKRGLDGYSFARWLGDHWGHWDMFDTDGGNDAAAMVDIFKSLGYDGAIIHEPGEGANRRTWVAFDPEQIKSAIGNSGTFDPKNPNITARMGSRPTQGIAAAELQAVAERVTRELGVTARVADTQADLPDYIQVNIPEGAVVTGMFVEDEITGDNEIWYVRENIDSTDEAYENALHEAVGHMGLRAVLGSSYHKVMADIRASFPEKVAWAERQNGIDVMIRDAKARNDRAAVRRLESLAAEELVAYAAGKVLQKRGALSEQSVWRKIVAKVRDILRNVGMINSYSGEDIEALIYRARDYFRKPAKTRAQEIDYRARMAAAVKQQPDGAPQWLDPDEYVSPDDLNPDPDAELLHRKRLIGAEPTPGAPIDEQIVFPPNFDSVMAGNEPFNGQTEVEAFADGRRIGYVTLSEDRRDDDGWSAEYVYVHPDYRKRGVAQRMYKAISDKLGVPARPSDIRTAGGRGMWNSFKRRNVAFRMKNRPQTQTPAFKEWFGDSKVVDENGDPLVVFHGTRANKDFDVFNTSPVSSLGGYELGSHFGTAEAANERILLRDAGSPEPARLIPVYLSIGNPIRFRDSGQWGPANLIPQLEEQGIDTSHVTDAMDDAEKAERAKGSVWNSAWEMQSIRARAGTYAIKDLLQKLGYDGVVYTNLYEGKGITPEKVSDWSDSLEVQEQSLGSWIAVDPDGKTVGRGPSDYDALQDAVQNYRAEAAMSSNESYIAFEPEQIKSAVGNLGTFNPTAPNISFAFKQGPTGNAELDSFIKKIGQPPLTLRQRWQNFKQNLADRAAVAAFDEFHGIKRAEDIAGISSADSGYKSARLSKASSELTQMIIETGPPIWNDGAPDLGQGMSLLSILSPLKGNVNLWLTYMTAQRANRLMGEGRENLFTQKEIDAALDLAKSHPEFDVARRQYNQLQKQVLDFAEQAGVIDPQGRALWEHADYIPFHRIVENGQVAVSAKGGKGIGFVKNQIKRLTGGKQNIGDPMENIVRNWLALMDASLKANAGREIIDNLNGTGLVTRHKGFDLSQAIIPLAQVKQFIKNNPVLSQTLQAVGLDPAKLPPQAFAGLQKMLAVTAPKDEDVISVWRNGKREYWNVHDPLLLIGLQGLSPKSWGPLMTLLTYPKRIITKGITLTPQFAIKNYWRDVWHVFVQGARAGSTRLDVLPTDSLKGLVSTFKDDATSKSLLAAGGSFTEGFVNPGDMEGSAKAVRRSLRKVSTPGGVILGSPVQLWRFYRRMQSAAENANRVAMYNAARKKGLTRKEAAFAARDLMDFSMKGNNPVVQFLVSSVPFFNARLQGLYRLGRGLKEDFASVALRGLLLTAATAALLARNYDDERYKALTDQEKSNYWHFFDVFQEGDHFRLPKPFEVGTIFGTVPEALLDAMFTNSDEPDGVKQSAQYIGYAFGETLNLAPHPQAIWPMVELAINQDSFTGTPILTGGDEGVLPEDQRGPRTSPTYAAIASAMPDVAPEALRSPKQLEHLGRGYLGNLQDYVLMATDSLVRQARGEPAPPERATQDFPGLKDFYKVGPNRNTRHTTTMYELASEAAKVQASIRRAEDAETDEGDARILELEEDHAELLEVADDFKDAAKTVTDLKKEQRQIQLDPSMTPDEKRTEIDAIQQEINETARDVYDLRPGGKLNPSTAAELLTAPPSARATILRKNNMPATADLLEQFA